MKKRLIINADDFGPNRNVVDSVIQGMEAGCITSTSVIVTLGDITTAVSQLKAMPKVSIGIHLNITSGKSMMPPEKVPSLVTADGSFFSRNELRTRASLVDTNELRQEFLAQIDYLRMYGIQISHIDNHHPEIYLFPRLFNTVIDIAHQMNLPIRMPFTPNLALFRNQFAHSLGVKGDDIDSLGKSINEQCLLTGVKHPDAFFPHLSQDGSPLEAIARLIPLLPEGTSELCLHVGTDTAAQRRDLEAVTHPEIKAILAENSIELVTYAEIIR